jgi:hypothetical protein
VKVVTVVKHYKDADEALDSMGSSLAERQYELSKKRRKEKNEEQEKEMTDEEKAA